MSLPGFDPGDRNNWYQSSQLGLFPTSPTGYSGGYYFLPSYHPHVTQFPSQLSYRPLPSQFPFQPSYSPPPPPSHTIINGFAFPHQFPSTHSHHSPDSNPNPWIYPSISQSHSYDPSVTSVKSHFVSTKTMPTSPVYHSAPSIPTFQSPSVSTFVPQHQFTDPKPLPLHSKLFRGCKCRVVMGAKARVSKKTRNPYLLRDVGKYSRSKRYHRRSLSVIKAKNGDIFPRHNAKATVATMEELHQLLVGQTTPITEPASSPLKFASLPAGSVALTAANGWSSMLSASSRGIQISEKPNLNLSPHEVILGLNKNFAATLITGIHSEHTTTAVVTKELVLNVDKDIAGGVHGVKFSDITDDEGSRVCIKEEALHEHYSIKTLVPQVFTTIISRSQYFQAAFYGVLCDVSKLYNHSSWNHKDGEKKNWGLDDRIEIMNGNALLCLFARCRVISDAMQLFGDMAGTNEVTFMAMMGELKKKDKVVEALEVFKLMWRKGVHIDSTSLFVDIERDPSFNALPLLKAIIKCKLVASEVYDLLTRVAELMVTSQVEPIRHKCIQILSHFLNDYPLSDKRFQQHLDFLLSNLSLSWYLGKKQQLWSVAAQVLRLLVEVGAMKKRFHKHINSVLQVTESILQSAIDVVTHDSPHETTILFWKEAFYSLVMLKEILNQFHDLCFDRDLEDIWEAIYVYLCCQLKAQLIGDAADKLITQNLAFTVCGLHYLMGQLECADSLSSILGFCAKECGEFGVKEHSDGRTFDSYQFTYISVQVHVEDPITEMSSSGGENINVPKFKSFASHLGITTFFINALQQSGHEILSQPIMVEVYAPSAIHLHDIFLVPGESYVLTLEEAPKIDANVEFTSLELLQNEYQIDQVDVQAVIAIVIIQLHSNETTELCKGMDKLLRAFGIYIAFAYLAYHLCSVGPQLLIEQFIDVAFVGNFYDTNVDQWLPAHDERSFCEGTKRISRRLLTLLTVHHFNNKMVQKFSYLQIIMKKLIQAELQVCKSNLDKLSDSSFLVWSFQLLEPKISFERPQPRVYHVGSRKTLRIIGFYDSSGHQPLAWCTFNPCSEDNSHIFLVDILGGFCLVALCSIEVTLVGMLNIIIAASLCVVCLTNVLLKSIAGFLSWKLSSYYCKCNSILPIVVIVDASEQIQQSFIRIVLYSMFVSYIMMAQKIIVEDNTKQVGTAWTFESTDILTGPVKMFIDEWGQPTSKLDCIILILEIATSCYELRNTFANVRMGMMTPSYTTNDKLGVHEATKMTKLADKGNVSFHQWGITFYIFYFEFVYHLFMSRCCWYNILGVASETTIIFKMLHMVDFCQDAPHAPRFSFRI